MSTTAQLYKLTTITQGIQRDIESLRGEVKHLHLKHDQLLEVLMATKETLDALTTELTKNTDATKSATDALTHYAQTTVDLTQELADAIAKSDASDDDAVKSAITTLQQNSKELMTAVPAVAKAVTANTAAASENQVTHQ